jgi:uncharacterized membrane protein YagU involved in acid resistance
MPMNRLLAGALGGTLATVPMTLVMVTLFRRLPPQQRYPLPPREITEVVVRRAAAIRTPGDDRLTTLTLAAHFGYGALTGAAYPLLGPRPAHPVLFGAGYGLAIWAVSYLGWIPAFGILRPATAHPRHRRRLMLVAHLVWGACTALLSAQFTRHRGGRGDPHGPA